jgi:hypothetical protein
MSEQASADDVSVAADRASNPQANMTGSGQDLEVQKYAHVLGRFDDEDSCFDLISTTDDDLESMVLSWSISSVRKGLRVINSFCSMFIIPSISNSGLHILSMVAVAERGD